MEPDATTPIDPTRSVLQAPRSAAVAGIVFAVLMIVHIVLIRVTVPAGPRDAGTWLMGGAGTVAVAVGLVPFAGIAFLWFVGVLRDRLGAQEDRFFATVFLGSALLFLATTFVSSAVAGSLLEMHATSPGVLLDSGLFAFGRRVSHELTNVYSMRMAGVFMISTCTMSLRTGILPRWMACLGFVLAAVLLLSLGVLYWTHLIFPLWVLLISTYIFATNLHG